MSIAALIAALVGTAMQTKATNDARSRQEQVVRESLSRNDELQKQGETKAKEQAQEFQTPTRQAAQQQIEQQVNESLIKPVETAQEINSSQATTQGNVSNDYLTSQAASKVKVLGDARKLASLMAKTTSAGRLRTDEALRMADTAAGIDRLGNFARGNAGVDELQMTSAGRPDMGLSLAGGIMQSLGSAALMGNMMKGAQVAATPGTLGSGTFPSAIPGLGAVNMSKLGTGLAGAGRGLFGIP